MFYSLLIALHLLGAIVWVGGMFFATLVLRPATQVLEPHDRLVLFSKVFPRFFRWVWVSLIAIVVSGYWVLFGLYGGFANVGGHVHIMQATGFVMIVLFAYMYFVPFRRFEQAVAANDMVSAGKHTTAIRGIITTNLILGLLTSAIGAARVYWG
ncbi:MAG: CopD family protein [Rhodospirillaceae bacterium]